MAVSCESATEDQVASIARNAGLGRSEAIICISKASQFFLSSESVMTRIGGLDGQIEESGKNLSFGERQIISMCRVLLAKCKVRIDVEFSNHFHVFHYFYRKYIASSNFII